MHKNVFLFLAVSWTVIVTVLSLVSLNDLQDPITTIPYKDKMVHFVFYFVFVLAWFHYRKFGRNNRKTSLIVFIAAIGYGLLMEVFQSLFTTTRTADPYDFMANSFGALSGLLFVNYKFLNKTQL